MIIYSCIVSPRRLSKSTGLVTVIKRVRGFKAPLVPLLSTESGCLKRNYILATFSTTHIDGSLASVLENGENKRRIITVDNP